LRNAHNGHGLEAPPEELASSTPVWRRKIRALCAHPLLVPASEFDWLVREFSRESGTKPTHIPMFGLVRFAVGITQPAGTSEMKLAIFENTNWNQGTSAK
jgi:hypothetical protein